MVRTDDLAQILGIEPGGECGRADQITEHHRQVPALGIGGTRGIAGYRHHRSGGGGGGGGRELGGGGGGGGAAPSEAIAARSLRRWPTEVTPMLIRSSDVSSGSTSPSTSFSRNAGAYRSSPSPRSHATTSMG